LNIKFGCSPFSIQAVDFLLEVGVDILKIPSGEITNHPLIEYISETGLPIHISSGMSTWAEIDEAIAILDPVQNLCLMQCASLYPAPPIKIGLNNILEMKNRYENQRVSIGFSDHSTGIVMPIAAVALGARAVEKHLTFSRRMYGSDAFNALEPMEFKEMSLGIREVEIALKNPVDKNDTEDFVENRRIFQKSIITGRNIAKGEIISLECVKFLKPANGLLPSEWKKIMGRRVNRSLPAGHLVSFEDFE
jgi:N-acetylneuraminate synthase